MAKQGNNQACPGQNLSSRKFVSLINQAKIYTMEYGRIPATENDKFDYGLPADPIRNNQVLKGQAINAKFYMGCPHWGRKEWNGIIYPKGTKDSKFQQEYVKSYNSIEFNATHYAMPSDEQMLTWKEKAGNDDFKFCPKFIKTISHYSSFENTAAVTDQFLQQMRTLGENLGPIFLQVSEKYSTNDQQKLFKYLENLPKNLTFFLEVRHPSWYTEGKVFEVLHHLKIGAVITDVPGVRTQVHMQLTIPKTFIRFQAIGGHPTDLRRIDSWAERLKKWIDNGLEEVYFFVHVADQKDSPHLTKYAAEQFNKVCDAKLPEVKILYPTLF